MKKVIGDTMCWNMKFDVIQLEDEKLLKHYIGKKVRWAWAHQSEKIYFNEIINVGTMDMQPDHYLIMVKPNNQDQKNHKKAAAEMKKKLDIEIVKERQPWLMWATYNKNLYSTFEIVD